MYTQKTLFIIVLLLSFATFTSCEDLFNSPSSHGELDWEKGEIIEPGTDDHLDDDQKSAYRQDAEKLALRYLQEVDPDETDLPENLVDLYYNGLIQIENSDHERAAEVTEEFNIHARNPANVRQVLVYADSTAPWIDNWRNEEILTGNPEVDALIEEFNFDLVKFREYPNTMPTIMVTLESDRAINPYAVGELFEELDGIDHAGPDKLTDGNDIKAELHNEYVSYSFEYGYGDCPAGCINRHVWNFQVFKDGTVLFTGVEGDPLPDQD